MKHFFRLLFNLVFIYQQNQHNPASNQIRYSFLVTKNGAQALEDLFSWFAASSNYYLVTMMTMNFIITKVTTCIR